MEMERENHTHLFIDRNDPENARLKTSLRLRYEAEARVLRDQMGSLDKIRGDLGLSRRKMCHLLLVDPSTWTRWMRDETKVPPHIFKAMQWYLTLIEKYPLLHPQHRVTLPAGERAGSKSREAFESLEAQRRELEGRISELEGALQSRVSEISAVVGDKQQVGVAWKVLLMFNTLFLLWLILRAL